MIDLLLVVGVHGTLFSLFQQSTSLPAGLDTTWILSVFPLYMLAKTTFIPGRLVVQGLALWRGSSKRVRFH
jgi:hypothetical protein